MKRLKISLLTLCLLCVASLAWACSVPVFRFALERWPNDLYEVVVFHKGELTAAQQKMAENLSEQGDAGKQHANVKVTLVDLVDLLKEETEESKNSEMIKLWEEQKTETLPWMVVKYPVTTNSVQKVWSGDLTAKHVTRLLDSPSRREISRRLLKGETAVWVFLNSGNKSADDAAMKTLQTHLRLAEKELELPEIDEADIEQGLVSVDETGLKLKFSTVQLSRDQAQESLFIEMLLGSEDDLRGFNEPMAFPVFGRGRVMYALIGKGINADTIRQTCQELIGPCTCEVKEENPGVDLLTSVDWENLVQPFVEIDRELPPLPGFGGMMETKQESDEKTQQTEIATNQSNQPAISTTTTPKELASEVASTMWKNILYGTAGSLLVVVLISFFVFSRKSN